MKRDDAIRLDGFVLAATASANRIAHYLKSRCDDDEYRDLVCHVGDIMGELFELSQKLYRQHPDIVPDELRPPGKTDSEGTAE